MRTDYRKLWKLLIDHNMTRSKLRLKAGISSVTLAKLGKMKMSQPIFYCVFVQH